MANLQDLPRIQDADLKGKRVLIRVDHNVVKKGSIKDPTRIEATFGTLFNVISKGGKPILMTHVGRPRDKKTGDINMSPDSAVDPIVDYLKQKLYVDFEIPQFPDDPKGYAGMYDSIKPALERLDNGAIDGIYLPNTRWFRGEEASDDLRDQLAGEFASIADVFVNDAFGSWQPHASTAFVPRKLPSFAGRLMQKELGNLDRIYIPEKPLLAVVAGSKFDTKIDTLKALLETADKLVLGGVMYNAYLCAKYGFKIKGIDDSEVESAKKFVQMVDARPGKLIEPPYIVESDTLDGKFENKYRTFSINDLDKGSELGYVLDVSEESFEDSQVKLAFSQARTIFVNAVMGMTPHFGEGTAALNRTIAANDKAMKLFGGGDTVRELKNLSPEVYIKSQNDSKYYLFTGGGAVLKAIQEGSALGLGPVKALIESVR